MPLLKSKVLVLNTSYEPLSICDARNAFLLLYGGKAETVTNHPELVVRTVSASFPLPSIVRLKIFARFQCRKPAELTRRNIFMRDGFTCQYCGRKEPALTIDHVIPRSKGGGESWDNLVTACRACNNTKGDRTPPEAGMRLTNPPSRPNRIALLRRNHQHLAEEWKPYLYLV